MSFGRKLMLLFIALVAVPMTAVAVLVVQITRDSRDGKADARLAAGLATGRALYQEALRAAPGEAERIARAASAALRRGDQGQLEAIASREQGSAAVTSVEILDPGGKVIASGGPPAALATSESDVRSSGGERLGTIRVSTLSVSGFLADVSRLTGRDAALVADRGVIESTRDLGDAEIPPAEDAGGFDVELADVTLRAASLELGGAPQPTRLVLFTPRESGFVASEPLIAVVLAGFFALAILFIAGLLGSLRSRIGAMLEAARRIGSGDFASRVPVEGNDEMAGLAREFNKMSERLTAQVGELSRQREELEESVKRIGEAFASGLDRRALLEIVIETATSACAAEGGGVVMYDRGEEPDIISPGDSPPELVGVLERASAEAFAERDQGGASDGDRHAVAHAVVDRRRGDDVLCTLAVARRGADFTDGERETLRYLVGQTAISIENIGLHERVAEQAVTDELTGIPNHRHFSDWLEREVARLDRYGGELSLVLLDVDNFKVINDTHGHLQGDRMLEELGRILRDESRGMDEAARYGGEEFVLALPRTSTEGAIEVAERLRTRIEETSVPGEDGAGPITITASLGVATMPADGNDPRSLIAAADAALYRAKRHGKNRVVSTSRDGVPIPQGIPGGRRSGLSDST